MFVTDGIADMLTRIRNANMVGHDEVKIPFAKMKESIAKILLDEGFISDYKIAGSSKRTIVVNLKYYSRAKEPVIRGLKRISKPGRRVYASVDKLPRVLRGLGVAVVSTPKGVMTDKTCREVNMGGEVLCYVW